MLFVKKIIVLSGERKGVLKLEKLGDNLSGTLSLSPIDNYTKIGIKLGDTPIFEHNIRACKESFRLPMGSNIEGDIACIVTDNGARAILASGANYKACPYPKLIMEMSKNSNLAKELVAAVPSKVSNSEVNKVEDALNLEVVMPDKNTPTTTAQKMISDKIVEQVSVVEDNIAEVATINMDNNLNIDNVLLGANDDGDMQFYDKIKDRLQELMASYPHDEELEKTVHSSKWVRVDYDDGNYYVVGVIEEDECPLFICYGVPVGSREDKLAESKSTCEWLPLDRQNVNGRGYWVLYQDARTGETVS